MSDIGRLQYKIKNLENRFHDNTLQKSIMKLAVTSLIHLHINSFNKCVVSQPIFVLDTRHRVSHVLLWRNKNWYFPFGSNFYYITRVLNVFILFAPIIQSLRQEPKEVILKWNDLSAQ